MVLVSHWQQQGDHLGVMAPTVSAGQRRTILDLDKPAMNKLGWELQADGANLATLHTLAQVRLAQELGVTVDWKAANSDAAVLRLTSIWIDQDNDNLDDRGELLNEKLANGVVYEWGWGGCWWGWGGYWQELDDLDDLDTLDDLGFWQNFSWQTVDTPTTDGQIMQAQTTAASVPEPTSIVGLLLDLFGLGFLRKRRLSE